MKNSLKKLAVITFALFSIGVIPGVMAKNMENTGRGWHHPEVKTEKEVRHSMDGFTVTAISGNTITATKGGTTYTIDATNADFMHRFGVELTLSEIAVGDKIKVLATDETKGSTSIVALRIRDFSLHYGFAMGTVASVGSNQFTLTTRGGETYTVSVESTTKFHGNNAHELNSLADVKVNDRVVVLGLKNSSLKTVKAKSVQLVGPFHLDS